MNELIVNRMINAFVLSAALLCGIGFACGFWAGFRHEMAKHPPKIEQSSSLEFRPQWREPGPGQLGGLSFEF